MFARVTTGQGPPDRLDEAARMIQEQVIPAVRQMSGYKGGYWMADRQSGKFIAVALWESEEALRASAAAMEQSRTQSTQAVGATIQSVDEYEVIAQG